MNKTEKAQQAKKADTHFASNRTQELLYQIAQFREGRGLSPVVDASPYRRPELKRVPMEPNTGYSID